MKQKGIYHYFVEGGNYQIMIAESSQDVRLKGTVSLSKYYFDDDGYTNEVLATSNNFDKIVKKFAKTDAKKRYMANGKGAPFGLKLFLAILLAIYANAVVAIFILGGINRNVESVFILALLAVDVLINILLLLVFTFSFVSSFSHIIFTF